MVTLHEVITFLVSMHISISSLQTHNVNRSGRSTYTARLLFFQAEDGIRDLTVTGVQTCALPICSISVGIFSNGSQQFRPRRVDFNRFPFRLSRAAFWTESDAPTGALRQIPSAAQIGRASCRERV